MKRQLPDQSGTGKGGALFYSEFKFSRLFRLLVTLILIFFSLIQQSDAQGTWTALAHLAPNANLGDMLLLSDGTVICKSDSGGTDGYGKVWDRLTPDIHGSYINGTWSVLPAMINTRLFYSSQVLMDGRVYVAGGEYGTGKTQAEVYNPLTNTWTAAPAPGHTFSDANSEILSNGEVIDALVEGDLQNTIIYNPVTNTWATGPTCLGIHNESAWVKLPDNSILFVNRESTSSERYIPASGSWIADGTVPDSLYDPYGDETGPGFLLPDGRAFFLGSTGHTAYYTPTGTTSPGTWAKGPDIPNGQGTPDAAGAMMVNGIILCAVNPVPTSTKHIFNTPTSFYEFNYLTNSFTLVGAPGGGSSLGNIASFQTNMLDLPDGNVLYAVNQDATSYQYYVYTPSGSPLAAGKPTIGNITQTGCTSFSITGTLFNGISEGAEYGDDGQMATNYPIVRITSGSNVYYARTFNWNRTGVQTGSLADTAEFTTPAGLATGTYSLVVIANGISSNSVSFTLLPSPTLSSTLTPPSIYSNTAFTYSPTSTSNGASFTWTRAAVTGISNAAITTAQTTNPNEVLINTTASAINVVYSYTITANGCSNSQSVTVTVNPALLLNLKIFIQGYYQNVGTTTPMDNFGYGGCLYLTGISAIPAEVDTVIISLMDSASKTQTVPSIHGVVHTNGSESVTLPESVAGKRYYLKITHRSAIETWSATTVLFGTYGSINIYDFTSNSSQAYGNNMVVVDNIEGKNVWAFWSGDVASYDINNNNLPYVQDGAIDGSDYGIMEEDFQSFLFGYYTTDITGDAAVDGSDYGLEEENYQLFIFKIHSLVINQTY